LLRVGNLIVMAAVAFQTVAHLGNEFALGDRIEGLDADIEGNIFTWASSVTTFAVAIAVSLYAAVLPVARAAYLGLAAVTTLFSLDDVIQLHERIGLRVGEDVLGLPDYAAVRLWLLFYLPLLAVAGWLLLGAARESWAPAGRAIRLGLVLLVGAVAVEIGGLLTRWLEERGTTKPEGVRVALEEGLELGGWALVAVGLLTAFVVALLRYGVAAAEE
jgi:hypothetical protein